MEGNSKALLQSTLAMTRQWLALREGTDASKVSNLFPIWVTLPIWLSFKANVAYGLKKPAHLHIDTRGPSACRKAMISMKRIYDS